MSSVFRRPDCFFQSGKVGSGMETEYNPLEGGGIKGGGCL